MSYERIVKVFQEISGDNGGCTADEIEEALSILTDDELRIVGSGEFKEQTAVCVKLRESGVDQAVINAMDELFEVAFEGPVIRTYDWEGL